MEGECLCKAVQVRVNDDNLFGSQRRGHICHCANCRKIAGGIFGVNLTIEEDKVEFLRGKGGIKTYADPETMSGTPVNRNFCGTCGCPIFSQTPVYKGKIILKLGLYPKLPVPEWESFVKDKQAWETPMPGTMQFTSKSGGDRVRGSLEVADKV
ncbi:uncharacterized protein HMPREF1541_00899 [Cyphellophora europaea CBS 101466]|uniref:CENP-V/GFA domain-containing protein n=1 Tax=Cyphellophora europaea (strain CBS 101466) TaxID=1220924 RepID=W2SDD1_CYPE1|nr:uncharacterized protein HMPREF1541_00899 [Cyphellophora europaea CBS 101466]ETN46712.1 hypothetical protein HMPREF1541_00899 [Cyphellophora europaea CBS 101466]